MPEADHEGKTYYTDVPQQGKLFFLKGSNELDWGMKNRLSRIFNPADGRTVSVTADCVACTAADHCAAGLLKDHVAPPTANRGIQDIVKRKLFLAVLGAAFAMPASAARPHTIDHATYIA